MARKTKRVTRIVLVAVGLAVVLFLLARNIVIHTLPFASTGHVAGVKELQIKLVGIQKSGRTKGHAHSPWGTWGRNFYEFSGTVEFGGVKCDLETKGFEPFAAFEFEDEKYLFLKNFFLPDVFQIKRVDSNATFTTLPNNSIPASLRLLEFKEVKIAYLFRAWNLKSLKANMQYEDACSLFQSYTQANPRFAYPQDPWRNGGGRRTELLDFIRTVVSDLNCDFGETLLKEILEASCATDDPQIIANVALTIYQQNPERNAEYLCDFKARAEAEDLPEDMRVSALGYGSLIGKKLRCH